VAESRADAGIGNISEPPRVVGDADATEALRRPVFIEITRASG
jgi:hypothetical protein